MKSERRERVSRRRSRLLLRCEQALVVVGFLSLAAWMLLQGRARFYGAYDVWAFDAKLAGERPSIARFVQEWARGGLSRRSVDVQPPAAPEPRTLDEKPPDFDGWSRRRIRRYQASLERVRNEPMGRLDIPSIDLSAMVFEGTDGWTLNRAVGHVEGSALPGELGNIAIAGHRDGYFRGLQRIGRNDVIELTTPGDSYRYRVEGIEIVRPDDVRVLRRSDRPTLTLITCYPFHFVGDAPKRFVVKARLEEMAAASAEDDAAAPVPKPEARPAVPARTARSSRVARDPAAAAARSRRLPTLAAGADQTEAPQIASERRRLVRRLRGGLLGIVKKPVALFRRGQRESAADR